MAGSKARRSVPNGSTPPIASLRESRTNHRPSRSTTPAPRLRRQTSHQSRDSYPAATSSPRVPPRAQLLLIRRPVGHFHPTEQCSDRRQIGFPNLCGKRFIHHHLPSNPVAPMRPRMRQHRSRRMQRARIVSFKNCAHAWKMAEVLGGVNSQVWGDFYASLCSFLSPVPSSNPHSAFYSEEGLMDMRVKGSENCRRALLGQPVRNLVNGAM